MNKSYISTSDSWALFMSMETDQQQVAMTKKPSRYTPPVRSSHVNHRFDTSSIEVFKTNALDDLAHSPPKFTYEDVFAILLQLQWVGYVLTFYHDHGLPSSGADTDYFVQLKPVVPNGTLHFMDFTLRHFDGRGTAHRTVMRARWHLNLLCAKKASTDGPLPMRVWLNTAMTPENVIHEPQRSDALREFWQRAVIQMARHYGHGALWASVIEKEPLLFADSGVHGWLKAADAIDNHADLFDRPRILNVHMEHGLCSQEMTAIQQGDTPFLSYDYQDSVDLSRPCTDRTSMQFVAAPIDSANKPTINRPQLYNNEDDELVVLTTHRTKRPHTEVIEINDDDDHVLLPQYKRICI